MGQREGIGVGGGTPYYVVQKDIVKNRLVVAPKSLVPEPVVRFTHHLELAETVEGPPSLYSKSVSVSKVHWIGEQPELPLRCSAKIRYQQPDQECEIFPPLLSSPTKGGGIPLKKIPLHRWEGQGGGAGGGGGESNSKSRNSPRLRDRLSCFTRVIQFWEVL